VLLRRASRGNYLDRRGRQRQGSQPYIASKPETILATNALAIADEHLERQHSSGGGACESPREDQCDATAAETDDPAARMLERTRSCWGAAGDEILPLDSVIGVGVGYAALTRNGTPIYEQHDGEFESLITVAQAESLARCAADCDWRIHLVGLLEDRHYRREGPGRWKLYKRGYGLS
jgi:hypothetical protein